MALPVLVLVFFLINVYLLNFSTDAEPLGSLLLDGFGYLSGAIVDPEKQLFNPVSNKESSLSYQVYTRKNPTNHCILEPNEEALKNCPIDSAYPTQFLIHGFLTDLKPGNLLEVTKDVLLEREALNVIILDWTKYNKPPYALAIHNIYTIADKVVELLKFLGKHANIQIENVSISAHSLGAQLAGAIGKKIKEENLGKLKRIDAVDPAGPLFQTPTVNSRLSYTDADFVQVIHTSDVITGLGLHESLGHMDFYVNGGRKQPHCKHGSRFQTETGNYLTVDNFVNSKLCNHQISIAYYIDTINSTDCKFLGTKCNNYEEFQEGKCTPQNSVVGEMGAFGSKIPGLPPYSNFSLRTSSESPYCLKDGYLP